MSDDTEQLAQVLFERANPGQQWAALLVGARRKFSTDGQTVRTHRTLATTVLAWLDQHRPGNVSVERLTRALYAEYRDRNPGTLTFETDSRVDGFRQQAERLVALLSADSQNTPTDTARTEQV